MVATIFRLPSSVSRRTKRAAMIGGVGYILVLLASWVWAYGPLPEFREPLYDALDYNRISRTSSTARTGQSSPRTDISRTMVGNAAP